MARSDGHHHSQGCLLHALLQSLALPHPNQPLVCVATYQLSATPFGVGLSHQIQTTALSN